MQMNAGIILSGQQPDFVNTLARSTQAAQLANQNRDQNALRQLYQTQGQGIAAGDPNALNALARIDPMAALGVQSERQNMAAQSRRTEVLNAQEARAVEAWAMEKSAAEREAAAAQVEQGLMMGIQAYRAGDLNAVNSILQQAGEAPIASLDEFPGLAARYKGALDVLVKLKDFDAPPGADTEAEREITRLMSLGIPRDVAVKIKEGVYKLATNPQTGLHTVIDLSSPPQSAPVVTEQQPETEQPNDGAYRFGEPYQSSDTAFGAGGLARNFFNTAADSVGAPVPFSETQQTQADFGILRESLINDISSGYNRQPPGWLMKNIEALTPQAGNLFEGKEGAKTKLRAIGRALEGELRNVKRQLQRPMRETRRQELEAKVSGLESALFRVDEALTSFPDEIESWMTDTDVSTWTEEQMQAAEKAWGIK